MMKSKTRCACPLMVVMAALLTTAPSCLLSGPGGVALAAETFLPMQTVQLSGRLVTPSCSVWLDTDSLRFDRSQPAGVEIQRQVLHLEQCDVESVDLAFTAATWPEAAGRGELKSSTTQRPSRAWHYRVAPDMNGDVAGSTGADGHVFALQPMTESVALVQDTPIPDRNPDGLFYRLDSARYEYRVPHAPQREEDTALNLPLLVSVHHDPNVAGELDEDLEAVFSLQLTYR